MVRTKLFKSDGSQAVWLTKEMAFPETVEEVAVIRDGARRLIMPVDALWDDFFSAAGTDIADRDQTEKQNTV